MSNTQKKNGVFCDFFTINRRFARVYHKNTSTYNNFVDFFASRGYNNIVKMFTEDNKMEVTKDSIIGDVLDYDIDTAQFFFEIGMHCLGCPASRGESIEMACAVHGTDPDELVEKINAFLAAKK